MLASGRDRVKCERKEGDSDMCSAQTRPAVFSVQQHTNTTALSRNCQSKIYSLLHRIRFFLSFFLSTVFDPLHVVKHFFLAASFPVVDESRLPLCGQTVVKHRSLLVVCSIAT